MKKKDKWQTVVETPEFIKQAKKNMDDISKASFIDYIANNPLAGDLITGTGGVRKIRWTGDSNQGKRGGVRVIYYYNCDQYPIFLFTAYAKNTKSDLTKAEKNELQKIVKLIIEQYEDEVL